MFKKTFTLALLLFLTSCGYQAIHSDKNSKKYAFSINHLDLLGARDINIKVKQKLNNYTLSNKEGKKGKKEDKKDKNFALKITSSSERVELAKNIAGDPTNFKITINVKTEVSLNNNYIKSFQITESFSYDNVVNKFDLKRYEREIRLSLAETIVDKIIFELSNIQ